MERPTARVVREGPAMRATRADLVARLSDAEGFFALLGGGPTEEGRYSVFCARPVAELVVEAGAPPFERPPGA
ncbi:MAG TPA: hypothetical protein VEI02_16725, partial [Planctomycetota bacterium]|nr:hypothetical protein [Planctomycetota bacterium]